MAVLTLGPGVTVMTAGLGVNASITACVMALLAKNPPMATAMPPTATCQSGSPASQWRRPTAQCSPGAGSSSGTVRTSRSKATGSTVLCTRRPLRYGVVVVAIRLIPLP